MTNSPRDGQRSQPGTSLILVAAVAENGVIGRAGGLPWRLKSDMQHFRKVTMGKPVVMGRKTYLSIGKPLVGRTNIVVTRDPSFSAQGVVVADNLDAALDVGHGDALRRGVDTVAVIGGADIYSQLISIATRLEITLVHAQPLGDVVFPAIDPAVWHATATEKHQAGSDDDVTFTFLTYLRVQAGA